MRGRVIFVIGVAGCGKTTVARALAQNTSAEFLEGDEFHSPENVAHMADGNALSDDMRWGWLGDLAAAADDVANSGRDVLVACSGLKRAYRDLLRQRAGPCRFIFLHGDKATILSRMQARTGHYMPASLLDSQFQALEVPDGDETDLVSVAIAGPAEAVIAAAARLAF